MRRLAWSVVGKVSQAAEGLFGRRPPKAAFEGLTRAEAPRITVPSRGFVTAIHRGSRGFVGRYLANSQQSELIASARSRYRFGEGLRGTLGQRLATFGFVGVGVAAGAQWPVQNDYQFDGVSLFKQVHDMFGTFASNKVLTQNAFESFEQLSTENISHAESCKEPRSDFVLLENSSFESVESTLSDDSDISILSDYDDDENQQVSVHETRDVRQTVVIIEETKVTLQNELKTVLACMDEQATELDALRHVVLQLNSAIHQLLGDSEPADSSQPFEELDDVDVTLSGSGDDPLMRSLVVVNQQTCELDALHKTVALQNKRLLELLEYKKDGNREIAVRTAHCKRDACCGPGSEKHC